MRTLAAIFFLAAIWIPAKGQGQPEAVPEARYFKKVNAVHVQSRINHSGKGTFVDLVPKDHQAKQDTVRVWVQGVRWPDQPPNRDSSRAADMVIWCFPQRFESEKHVFPEAEGRVLFKETADTFAVLSETLYENVR